MAYINQYEADMREDAKRNEMFNQFGGIISDGIKQWGENRRRAVDAKRAQQEQDIAFSKDGISPEAVAEYRKTGDASGMQKLYAELATAKRDQAARDAVLNREVKESTIAANNAKAMEAGKPFLESKEGQAYQAKLALEAERDKNKQEQSIGHEVQKEFTKKNVQLASVKGAMDAALAQLKDPSKSEEEKVKVGQGLLKMLNSAEGADAVGAEEAKRIGGYLEYQRGNFFEPGKFWGRDLNGFVSQVENNANLLADRIRRAEQTAQGVAQGQPISQAISPAPQVQAPPQVIQKLQSMAPEQKAARLQELRAKKAAMQGMR